MVNLLKGIVAVLEHQIDYFYRNEYIKIAAIFSNDSFELFFLFFGETGWKNILVLSLNDGELVAGSKFTPICNLKDLFTMDESSFVLSYGRNPLSKFLHEDQIKLLMEIF